MNTVSISADFADQDGYRLLAMERTWVEELKRCSEVVAVQPAKRARIEEGRPNTPSVLLVMKGGEQLCASDNSKTLSVRRVEYSNTLLVAERWAKEGVDPSAMGGAGTIESIRASSQSVTRAALARLFEAHQATPQQNALETLRDSIITISELEGSADSNDCQDATLGGKRHYTFPALVTENCSSPAEVAAVLTRAGAIVHRGLVRLLDTAALHEALRAVLTFLDSAEPSDMCWGAIEAHFCPAAFPRVVIGAVRGVYGLVSAPADDVQEAGLDTLLDFPRVIVGLAGAALDETPDSAGASHGEQPTLHPLPHGVTGVSMPFEKFYPAWLGTFPVTLFGVHGVPVRDAPPDEFLNLLAGYVVCHKVRRDTHDGSTAWWLPRDSLPNDIAKRLDILFTVHKEKYPAAVLQPYIAPLLPPDQTFSHAMLRHAREYRVPGEPVAYSRLGG